jgi:predicted  nucleic acid-binding Zn-ribbon protein
MDDSNLYSDLESLGALEEAKRLRGALAKLEKRNVALESELEETKQQVKKLVEEKSVLEKNLSAVWTTAKAEMDRKDKRIVELNNKVASFSSSGGTLASNKSRKLK